jgi:5,5'-dehydrodivanillate O-demethylase oxygenase subunit
VIFRMPPASEAGQLQYGLVAEQCPHRLASLAYGRVDAEGIRCPYHGWKFDPTGRCIEQPAEPADSTYKNEIQQPAYPVQKMAGLLFAYMGPLPAPLLPRWDVLVREDGRRWVTVESTIDCNWLQPMENSVDPSHLFWLHGFAFNSGHLGTHTAQYQETREFIRFEYGIMKRRTTHGKVAGELGHVDEHPMIFPLLLRHVSSEQGVRDEGRNGERLYRHNIQIRVPVDDHHTRVFRVNFVPSASEHSPEDQDPPFEYSRLKDDQGVFDMSIVSAQDAMAWETQGSICDRSREHLGATDRGVIMLRKLIKEQIDIVQAGGDPMGVIRDPEKNRMIEIPVINERLGLFGKDHGKTHDKATHTEGSVQ